MKTVARIRTLWRVAAAIPGLLLILVSTASGQYRDDYGDAYGDVGQTVARISFLEGRISFSRGDDPDNWQPADRNVTMTWGDRIYTGSRSRLELQIHGGDYIRLAAQTDLEALNLTDDTKQFSVKIGVASFQVRRLGENDVFEIDTPNAAITVDQPGEYRVDVDQNGRTRLYVRRGRVTVAAGGGQVPVRAGEEMDIEGLDAPSYDIVAFGRLDGWDRWVQQRQGRVGRARSFRYVSQDVIGVDDLDDYGNWQQIPEHGWAWAPTSVAVDWAPYREGHWIWQDPWGWTWVSAEPWGWAPYHYGRWISSSSRWYWVPVAPSVRSVAYSPACVAFVGGGPGWSASVTIGGGGFVGWFPLGPREPLIPWWERRATNVNVTNVTFVNRNYVTVVNQNTFVSGGLVANAVVRDRNVLQQVVTAPVMRGPLPVIPTPGSLRMAARTDLPPAQRPPAQIIGRAVVARVAPPPAPPPFQAKIEAIRQNRGAPLPTAEAAKISVDVRGRPQTITDVRPVVAEPGKITLAPRGRAAEGAAPRPEPVAPVRGRPLALPDRPVAPGPVTSSGASTGQGREAAPSREIAPRPGASQAPSSQPAPPAPQRGREQSDRPAPPVERAAPPAERAVPPPQRAVTPAERIAPPQPAERVQPQSAPSDSWRNRERPAEARPAETAPRNAAPQNEKPTPQPADRGRQGVAPPPARPAEQSNRGQENAAPPPPERRRVERPTPEAPRAPAEARPAEQRPAPPREAQPPAPPDRQVQRPAPQKADPKKEEKTKEEKAKEEKKKKDEQKNKDDRERKPE